MCFLYRRTRLPSHPIPSRPTPSHLLPFPSRFVPFSTRFVPLCLCQTAAKEGLILVDTKYEMGKDANGTVIVVDEIHTPDSSRYWVQVCAT